MVNYYDTNIGLHGIVPCAVYPGLVPGQALYLHIVWHLWAVC